jgi:DNA-binding Xre family transcriptional regulator
MSKGDSVTLKRRDYEALIDRVEDADDRVTIAAAEAREKALGVKAARADALPLDLVKALAGGTHPVRVWRKHREMTLQDLSAATGIAQSYLTEIETGKKPGSLDAMIKVAAALKVSLDDLVAWL